jgi:ketosteroid isomerase-like protein
MSEQYVETVKRLYEGLSSFNIEMVMAAFDPEVVLVAPKSLPWSEGDYKGLDGAARYFGGAIELLEKTRFDVEDLLPSGDWVTALGYWSGTFKSTGKSFNVRFVHFWILRDGKVVRAEGISDTVPIVRAFEPGLEPASN